jgi:nitrate reductase beta subunit
MKLFYNPWLPELDDYYEPFTFRYQDLFVARRADQPTASISMVTGEPIEIKSGPNWTMTWADRISIPGTTRAADLPEAVRQQMPSWRIVSTHAAHLQSLPQSGLCCGLPSGAFISAARMVVLVNENKCRPGGCAWQPAHTRGLLQLVEWEIREVHPVLPRLETGQRPRPFLRWASAPWACCSDADRIPNSDGPE